MASGFVAKHAVDGSFAFLFSLLSILCGLGFWILCAGRNHDIHSDLALDRLHGIEAAAVVKNSDHSGMGTYHRPHDAAFGAAIRANRDDIDQHAVAVHGVADGV